MKTTEIQYKPGAVQVRTAHSLPHINLILMIAVATAPDTDDGIMWVTEAWRPERHPNDAHTWCNAFDIRIRNIVGEHREEKILKAMEWVKSMRAVMNDKRYQFQIHGEGPSVHIHAEFDPR